MSQSSSAEQVDELRADLTTKVAALLDVNEEKARKIVEAFDLQIARPVESKFAKLQAHDLLKRNPYFYGVLGVTSVEDWIDRALAPAPAEIARRYDVRFSRFVVVGFVVATGVVGKIPRPRARAPSVAAAPGEKLASRARA